MSDSVAKLSDLISNSHSEAKKDLKEFKEGTTNSLTEITKATKSPGVFFLFFNLFLLTFLLSQNSLRLLVFLCLSFIAVALFGFNFITNHKLLPRKGWNY